MKITELRKKSKLELKNILKENREKLRVLRFNLATGKVKNVREVRRLKKDIARILMLINISENHRLKTANEVSDLSR